MEGFFTLQLKRYDLRQAAERLAPLTRRERAWEKLEPPELLRARHIGKRYGEKEVLRNVSITVNRGEKVLLRGTNGSGKSTLLRVLLGIEPPEEGAVAYGEALRGDAPPVSFALQEEPPLPFGGQEIGDAVAGRWGNGGELRKCLAGLGLTEEDLKKPLSRLSGGQRKKFYLAVALAGRSPLLILDEPSNHLDVESTAFLSRRLCQWTGAVVVCSHDSALAVDWDRAIEMKEGRIQ